MNTVTAKYLILAGLLLVLAGLLVYFFHDKLQWIGRLPGDIRVERPGFRFCFPLTTTILFSVLLTVISALVRRFF